MRYRTMFLFSRMFVAPFLVGSERSATTSGMPSIADGPPVTATICLPDGSRYSGATWSTICWIGSPLPRSGCHDDHDESATVGVWSWCENATTAAASAAIATPIRIP